MATDLPPLIAIVGTTSSGKSDLAVTLAEQCNGEVVSADSRQIYTGLDIGSGKITEAEMRGIPHHMLSVADPKDQYSVADYKHAAIQCINDIYSRGKLPILCGGTGFYIQAVIDNVTFVQTKASPELRAQCKEKTAEELFAELQQLDPRRAATIDPHNKVRLIRALEIVHDQGTVPEQTKGAELFNTLQIGVIYPADQLRARIHERLLKQLDQGMLEEVQRLHDDGVSWERLQELGLEYRYCADFLQGKFENKNAFITKLSTAVWQYARRQMTWFRRDKRIQWFTPDQAHTIPAIVSEFLKANT
jgi:tRNA dimethylallyltransferase